MPILQAAALGDTIRFVNDDQSDQNVSVPTADHAIDSGKQKLGQEMILALAKPGEFKIECVFHAGMELMVKATWYRNS